MEKILLLIHDVGRRRSRLFSWRERLTTQSSATGLATQLALAYAIHKSFIFIRVPLTAAVTPKAVKVLRSWGWNIGKKKA
jgi:hypothetical protein